MSENILDEFREGKVLLHPEAVSLLESGEIDASSVRADAFPEDTVVTPDMLRDRNGNGNGSAESGTAPGQEADAVREPEATYAAERGEPELEVLMDATGESEGEGELKDFRDLFRDKLSRSRDLLERRQGLNPRMIDTITSRMEREISVVGMVSATRRTRKDHLLVELEDESGQVPALVPNGEGELLELGDTLLEDEVVGVIGKTRRDSDLLLVREMFRPEVPRRDTEWTGNGYAAFISDVHVGSDNFLREELETFFSWLNGDVGSEQQRRIARRTDFLVIAGDLVEGIGVYPGQEEELETVDLVEQYEEAAELLDTLRKDLEILVAPGNHDATRRAEPQPALQDDYAEALEMENLTLISNPSLVDLDGVTTLIYHGRSLDDIMDAVPDASYDRPEVAMKELLKRRHLAPRFGGRTPLSPEKQDFLLVDEVPDVLHTGHVHTFGMDSYRGVTVINGGTWQSQTPFQERMGIEPDPGRAPLIDLATGERKVLRFA